ncbi:MAG TPA: sulfatase [Bacteroidales bacterium]|nr:sulfatase [Bacteroidales bacterium]
MKSNFTRILLIAVMAIAAACGKTPEPPPNIVIIFIDDQGYADLGCYGAQGFTTPNIDRLAEEGLRFTNFYVSEAVCSASRSSLLTGCYAQRVGIRGALSPYAMTGLNPEEETIASMLKKQGYTTCMVGKWHLGSIPDFYPQHYGFDEYLGLPYSNDMWPVGYDGKRSDEGYKSIYPELPLIEGDSVINTFKTLESQNEITGLYTERAVDFIKRNPDRPFFLYLAHSMVHVPLALNEKFAGTSEQGKFGDVMQEVDWSVGEVINTLRELGLEDNTLVIYTSDNGPWLNFGNHAGSALPLREGKGNAWEGGVRVPCVMFYPPLIRAGQTTAKMASTMDILPTIAALTGAPLPSKYIDGVNILPLLIGEENANPRNEFIYYYEGGLCAVRRGEWKLVLPHKYRSYAGVEPGRDGLPGLYSRGEAGLELYNLLYDISESNDVSEQYPEKVTEMLAMADSVRTALGDMITGTKGSDNRPPGRLRMIKESISHLGKNKKYEILNKPHHRYPGGTDFALTDGYLGSLEFTDESWLGFHGDDLDILIDLGSPTTFSIVESRFLSNQASWIFLPTDIELYAGNTASSLTLLDHISFDSAQKDLDVYRHTYKYSGNIQARFVRVLAKNTGTCPDWHPGKGEKAWLFVDEVVVN